MAKIMLTMSDEEKKRISDCAHDARKSMNRYILDCVDRSLIKGGVCSDCGRFEESVYEHKCKPQTTECKLCGSIERLVERAGIIICTECVKDYSDVVQVKPKEQPKEYEHATCGVCKKDERLCTCVADIAPEKILPIKKKTVKKEYGYPKSKSIR